MNKSILAIDIGTSSTICVIAQNDLNDKINILGAGVEKSDGIKNGSIADIDKASFSIKNAVSTAKNTTNARATTISSTIVSISGIHAKSIRSSGSINITTGLITKNVIKQVLTMALFDANIIPDYDVIHVIPLYFKVDDNSTIDNPLNMNGSRLEVYANIVTAKNTSLNNIKNALKRSNIDVTNFVLSSYASSISTLTDDQKKSGVALIDLGGSTSGLAINKNQSLIYNTIVPIGSDSITRDISITLKTPFDAADKIKNKYATLYRHQINENNIKKVKVPLIGNNDESNEISLDLIQPMIHARVEEILCLLYEQLEKNGVIEGVNNVVLTGGMSQIPGIEILAKKVFNNLEVKISNPKNIQNGYINFNNPSYSTIVGLLMYALYQDTYFELNSNKELREQFNKKDDVININNIPNQNLENDDIHDISEIKQNTNDMQNIDKKSNSGIKYILEYIKNKFEKLL